MGIRSLRTASISTGVKRSKVWDQSAVYSPTAYESIATQTVGAGGAASVTFSSIPSGYKHLQIRAINQTNRTTYNTSGFYMRLNSDTGNNYSHHILQSDPSSPSTSAISGALASQNAIYDFSTSSNVAANVFGAAIFDILDYANTSKAKTIRGITGADTAGAASGYAGWIALNSGAWYNTSAITSITFVPQFGTLFNQYSHFALYGIKG
jgi:hypothetical protein